MPTRRRTNDAYYTPAWLIESLLDSSPLKERLLLSDSIVEPCVGEGAISKTILARGYNNLTTNDIDSSLKADFNMSAQELLNTSTFNWVITNPPFNQAHEIVPLAYSCARKGVICLLRLTYLEPCKNRANWLKEHPPNILLVNKRVSFTEDRKTDSCTTAWFVWLKDSDSIQSSIDFML